MSDRNCSVESCDRKARTKGLCNRHYLRLNRRGTTDRVVVPDEVTYENTSRILAYSPTTGIITRKINWFKGKAGEEVGTNDYYGYKAISVYGQRLRAHRIAWLLHYREWPKNQIDHINGIRGDNRIINLRDVSNQENHRNERLAKNNSSGIIGVCWSEADSRWIASIGVNYKQIRLGQFKSKGDAVKVRLEAETKYNFHKNHGRA